MKLAETEQTHCTLAATCTRQVTVVCCLTENFLLDDVRNYRYLTHGNVGCSLDDHELYQELIEAFDIMGLNADEKAGKHR